MTQPDLQRAKKALLIAIDGPVAVGKSTVGRMVASRLGYRFVDTGTMYRALTWKAIEQKIPFDDEAALSRMSANTTFQLTTTGKNGQNNILMDGKDVTHQVRTAPVEKSVSLVSKVSEVRESLVRHQRRIAIEGRLVMAGRDIGTVVLPQAELKIFLAASPLERARRRYQELLDQSPKVNFEEVLSDLQSRDDMDIHRKASPLKPATDAYILDTEGLSAEQVANKICALALGKSPSETC